MSTGGSGAGLDKKLWTLTDLETLEFAVGQFVAQDVRKDLSARIDSSSAYNAQYPILQWIAGETEVVTFSAKLWANDATDFSVDDRLEWLEGVVRRRDDLGRPPVCAFALADVASLSIDCLVRTLGGITYDEVRDDGTLRGVTLQITLERFVDYDVEATDPTTPETFTRIRRARDGDLYETIALDEYGDPELGVLLRQLNPRVPGMDLANLSPKDPVHVFPESYLRTLPIEPEFHAFKTGEGNEAAEERRREIFDARSADAFLTIYADGSPEEF